MQPSNRLTIARNLKKYVFLTLNYFVSIAIDGVEQ